MSEKAASVKIKTFRKPGELMLKNTLKMTRKFGYLEIKYIQILGLAQDLCTVPQMVQKQENL